MTQAENIVYTSQIFRARFPLICSKFHFTDEDIVIMVRKFRKKEWRGERWCMMMIESIFDKAEQECEKISRGNGPGMTGTTYFANIAFEYIQNLFSVLELRKQIIIELLMAVTIATEKEMRIENESVERIFSSNFRATIFAKLLSGEWGSDCMMIFLHNRSIFQEYCNINFREVSNTLREGNSKLLRSSKFPSNAMESRTNSIKSGSKVTVKTCERGHSMWFPSGDKKLQNSLYFLTDVAFKSVPVLAFEISVLPVICSLLLPDSAFDVRNNMARRILLLSSEEVNKAVNVSCYSTPDEADLYVDRLGFKSNGAVVISGYMIFYFSCLEWQQKFHSDVNKEIVGANVVKNFHVLNDIYTDDCMRVRKMNQTIDKLNVRFANCENEMLKLKKIRKCLERKHDDGVTDYDEMVSLANFRVTEMRKMIEKKAICGRLGGLRVKEGILNKDTTQLWDQILPNKSEIYTNKDNLAQSDRLMLLLNGSFSKIHGSQSAPWRLRARIFLESTFIAIDSDRIRSKSQALIVVDCDNTKFKGDGMHSPDIETYFAASELAPWNELESMKDRNDYETPSKVGNNTKDNKQGEDKGRFNLEDDIADGQLKYVSLRDFSSVVGVHVCRISIEGSRCFQRFGYNISGDLMNTFDTVATVSTSCAIAVPDNQKIVDSWMIQGSKDVVQFKYLCCDIDGYKLFYDSFVRDSDILSFTWKCYYPIISICTLQLFHQFGNNTRHTFPPASKPPTIDLKFSRRLENDCLRFHCAKTEHFTMDISCPYCSSVKDVKDSNSLRSLCKYTQIKFLRSLCKYTQINSALERKFAVFSDDAWNGIDLNPRLWLSRNILVLVEKKHCAQLDRRRRFFKSNVFRCILDEYKVSIILKRRNKNTLFSVMQILRENVFHCKILRTREMAIMKIQRNLKALSIYRKFQIHLSKCHLIYAIAERHYKIKETMLSLRFMMAVRKRVKFRRRVEKVSSRVNDNVLKFRFLVWRQVCYRCEAQRTKLNVRRNLSALRIQRMFRCSIADRKAMLLSFKLKLGSASRLSISRKRLGERRRKIRCLLELSVNCCNWNRLSLLRAKYSNWWKVSGANHGLFKVFRVVWKNIIRKHFLILRKIAAVYHQKYHRSVVLIQSISRMFQVKRNDLNYYRWREGILSLQAIIRKRAQLMKFSRLVEESRAAQAIQKTTRGFLIRSRFFDSRTLAIHYSASVNNFEKLLHLTRKYPEMMHELDKDGNTALHNAARNASRRTLKLLVKEGLDPNVINLMGYSSLHMIIMSKATNRDDCCLYMLNRGFSPKIPTPDGKSCLFLACEYNRAVIACHLIVNGEDPNTSDIAGITCLQTACRNGSFGIVSALLEYGADPNSPGGDGLFPLHDAVGSRNVDLVKEIVSYGADVNAVDSYNYQTPLMWACQIGSVEIVRYLLLEGAIVNMKDQHHWTALHYSALSNDRLLIQILLEADADFDIVNRDGNTALHIAVQNYSTTYLKSLLELCATPSIQNLDGNEPLHIASRNNDIDSINLLCLYSEYTGKVNYSYETPYGIARAYGAEDALLYFNSRFVHGKNYTADNGGGNILTWNSKIEGSQDIMLPSVLSSAEDIQKFSQSGAKVIRKRVKMVTKAHSLTMHAYKMDYICVFSNIKSMILSHKAATILTKYARRKLAYIEANHERNKRRVMGIIKNFFMRFRCEFLERVKRRRLKGIIRFQGVFRGYKVRTIYYSPLGEYYHQYIHRAKSRLSSAIWSMYTKYKRKKKYLQDELFNFRPEQWEALVSEVKRPVRVVGIYEEYLHPSMMGTHFYKNKLTGKFLYPIPSDIRKSDDAKYYNVIDKQLHGFSEKENEVSVKLQSIWRGHVTRNHHKIIAAANKVSFFAEIKYFQEPNIDHHLWNYALHCFVVTHDIERARGLYIEALRRMGENGPDQAFILYCYAIFGFVTHDLDYVDVHSLVMRGRKAEEARESNHCTGDKLKFQANSKNPFIYGNVFRIADVGFFKYQAMRQRNSLSAHNFAASRFLVFNDFMGSFDSFMEGFKWNAKDVKLKSNFDIMMRHFHGDDKEVLSKVVLEKMRGHAERDLYLKSFQEHRNRKRLLEQKMRAATILQKWWLGAGIGR